MNLKNEKDLDTWDSRLQSEVISYNLDKPMTMIGFLDLPEHAKSEYLTKLKKTYGAGVKQIASMLGITVEATRDLMKRYGISTKGPRIENAEASWAAFLGDYKAPGIPEKERFTLSDHTEPDPDAIPQDSDPAPETPQNAPETTKTENVPVVPVIPEPAEAPKREPSDPFMHDIHVVSVLHTFWAELSGPLCQVLEKLREIGSLVGDTPVRVSICTIEQEEMR